MALAQRERCPSIAYTYNDPVIFAEYVIDTAREARAAGIRNVLVTAGYVTPEARGELFRFVDAANVDLKGFTEEFYHRQSSGHLEPVLDTLRWLKRETDGVDRDHDPAHPRAQRLRRGDPTPERLDRGEPRAGGAAPLHGVSSLVQDDGPSADAAGDAAGRAEDRDGGGVAVRIPGERTRRRGADDLVPRLPYAGHGAGVARCAPKPVDRIYLWVLWSSDPRGLRIGWAPRESLALPER